MMPNDADARPAGMLVKVCGLNDPEAVAATAAAGADYAGFVFFPPSPRAVTPARAAALARALPAAIGRVGLFVSPKPGEVAAACDALRLDAIQLYASADAATVWRDRCPGVAVWLAHGIAAAADLPRAAAGADRLLIEAKPPAGATRPGGNAVPLDWRLLRGWRPPAPWMLAGGLTPANVAAAIAASGARAVDVSSGVERAPGRKDPALIHAFVAAARSAPAGLADTNADADARRPAPPDMSPDRRI